jgi:hypothetical protein
MKNTKRCVVWSGRNSCCGFNGRRRAKRLLDARPGIQAGGQLDQHASGASGDKRGACHQHRPGRGGADERGLRDECCHRRRVRIYDAGACSDKHGPCGTDQFHTSLAYQCGPGAGHQPGCPAGSPRHRRNRLGGEHPCARDREHRGPSRWARSTMASARSAIAR